MPEVTVAVVDSLDNPGIDKVSTVSRIAVLDDTERSRWSSAIVIKSAKGNLAVHRADGVAVLVGRKVTDKAVLRALKAIPDPVLIVALDRAPGRSAQAAIKKRGGTIVVPGVGGIMKVEAINEPETCTCEVIRIAGGTDVKKPVTPAPVAPVVDAPKAE